MSGSIPLHGADYLSRGLSIRKKHASFVLKFHFSFLILHSNWLNSFHCLIQTTFFWLMLQSIGRTRKPVTAREARRVFQFINFWHIRNHRSVANGKDVCPYENDAERFLSIVTSTLLFIFQFFSLCEEIKEGETGARHCVILKWKMAIESEKKKTESQIVDEEE